MVLSTSARLPVCCSTRLNGPRHPAVADATATRGPLPEAGPIVIAPFPLMVMDQAVSADSSVLAMPGAVPSAARSPKVQDEGDGAAAMLRVEGWGPK